MQRLYGQPKIHKPGVSICPTVSYSGSPLHNLNKHIANILKANGKDENNNAKNSTVFSNYIRTALIGLTVLYSKVFAGYLDGWSSPTVEPLLKKFRNSWITIYSL